METKFISKFCLFDGILVKRGNSWSSHPLMIEDCYIHDTLEEAKIKAEQMRLAEIEKLQSKLTKLQELRF
jgi:hypothetical protein